MTTQSTDTALLDLRLLRSEVRRTLDDWEADHPLPTLTAIVLHRHMATLEVALRDVSDVIGSNGGGHPDQCDCLSCEP